MGPTFVKIDKLSGAQLAILSPLVSLATLGIMFFSPALAAMSVHFHITEGQVQMTQLLYLIGYGVGQIPYGPLSNRIGRKSTIYLGCVIASFGCFLCLIAAVRYAKAGNQSMMSIAMRCTYIYWIYPLGHKPY